MKHTTSQANGIISVIKNLTAIKAPHALIDTAIDYIEIAVDKKQAFNNIKECIEIKKNGLSDASEELYDYTAIQNLLNNFYESEKRISAKFDIPHEIEPIVFKTENVKKALVDEWQDWNENDLVLISAETGLGKSYFIKNYLIPELLRTYRIDERNLKKGYRKTNILVLSNRIALNIQNKIDIAEILKEPYIKNFSPEGIRNCINKIDSVYIFSYHQFLQHILNQADPNYDDKYEKERSKYMQDFLYVSTLTDVVFEYIIIDEVQFFTQDSLFNPYTELIYDVLFNNYKNAIKICMSATCKEILPKLIKSSEYIDSSVRDFARDNLNFDMQPYKHMKYYSLLPEKPKYQYNLSDVDFFEDLASIVKNSFEDFKVNKKRRIRPKWLIFVSSIARGQKLLESIEMLCNDITVKFFSSKTKNNPDESEDYFKTIFQGGFEFDVLITTTVLDNGININEPPITDLALDVFDETTTIQCAGRVRANNSVPVLNLYLQQYKPQFINNRLTYCKRIVELFENNDKRKLSKAELKRYDLDKIWYEDINGKAHLNNFARIKAKNMLSFFNMCNSMIIEDPLYFLKKQCDWFGISHEVITIALDNKQKTVIEFLKKHEGSDIIASNTKNKTDIYLDNQVPFDIFAEEFKQLYIKLYGKRYKTEKINRKYGLNVIRKCINEIGLSKIVKIESRNKQKTKLDVTIYNIVFFSNIDI